jgi:acetyl-CoA synthetase
MVSPRIEAYHFYEQDWEGYDELYEAFEWVIPEEFNKATYVCDRWAEENPDRAALHCETQGGSRETVTYGRLQEEANALASFLHDRGVGRGDRVAVTGVQKPETVIGHIATWKLGAISVPLSPLFGTDGLSYRLADCNASAYLADDPGYGTLSEVDDSFPDLHTVVTTGTADPDGEDEYTYGSAIEDQPGEFETASTDPEDDSIIFYTSGTTGSPKGVVHAHRSILGRLPFMVCDLSRIEIADDNTFYVPAAWSWMGSLGDSVLLPMYYGFSIVAYHGQFEPKLIFEFVDRYEVTSLIAPNTVLRMMMAAIENPTEEYDTGSVRVIPSGGEALDQSVIGWVDRVFDAPIHQGFGQTEADGIIANSEPLGVHRNETLGKPLPGHEVTIVDTETAEPTVETGEIGEIAVRYEGNPTCFKEYWNMPEKTEQKVRNGWLLTEDLGWEDEEGFISYKSRKDDVIISSGYRIGPEEIEETLGEHPAVADSGVIGVPDEFRGEVPKAFVELREGDESRNELQEELQQFVKDRLAKYEYPRELEFIDELPKTVTSKIRRKDLREREGIE